MTLDEAIKHCEDVASDYSDAKKIHAMNHRFEKSHKCEMSSEEHRQLAEWLKDYKRLLEQRSILDKIRTEIEELNPVDYGSMFSYESHNGAKYMKDDVLQIIDRHREEAET